MKKIKITIRKDGSHDIDVIDAEGDECLAFTRPLEERLGTLAGERTLKSEYADEPREEDVDEEREDAGA